MVADKKKTAARIGSVIKAFFCDKATIYRNMIFFAWLSIFFSAGLGVGKIAMSLFNHSWKFAFGGIYNFGICAAKIVAVKAYTHINGLPFKPFKAVRNNGQAIPVSDADKARIEKTAYRLIGIIVMLASLAYSAGSIWVVLGEQSMLKFGLLGTVGIGIITAVEIIVAVWGYVMRRRENQSLLEALKLTCIVSSLLGLVLVQTAIVGYLGNKPIIYFDYAGIVLGGVSALIGLSMILKPYFQKRSRARRFEKEIRSLSGQLLKRNLSDKE